MKVHIVFNRSGLVRFDSSSISYRSSFEATNLATGSPSVSISGRSPMNTPTDLYLEVR
jgi:hypothetical protein